jgi:NAD-dependent SIR2 family protein deacetylase
MRYCDIKPVVNMRKEKTVYILGAGASRAVGLPLQAELLSRIFNFKIPSVNASTDFIKLTLNPIQEEIQIYYEAFDEERRKLADFIIENFAASDQKKEYATISGSIEKSNNFISQDIRIKSLERVYALASDIHITLEDLFTMFDKITLNHENFHSYSQKSIDEIHSALRKCIIFVLTYDNVDEADTKNSYRVFAQKLIRERLNVPQKDDPIAVITMNWDSALEKEIYRQCRKYNRGRKTEKIFPDLCFYDYVLVNTKTHMVSTHIRAKGHYNLKLMKLHGAINWLVCPCCDRVYVDYEKNIAIKEIFYEQICPYCFEVFGDEKIPPKMRSTLITPTFLKDLNSLHIKNIWHNAFLDLTEATKLIFIGYSFPDADFEMRYLLKKAIRPQTPIKVILHKSDDPEIYREDIKSSAIPKTESERLISKLYLPESRYISFFGRDAVEFSYEGIETFVNSLQGGIANE